MAPQTSTTTRRVLVLLTAAAFLGWLPRSRRVTTLRRHIEHFQKISPIQQFAEAVGQTAFFDREGHFAVRVVAYRDHPGLPYLLVPVDDRVLAGWLS